MTAYACYLLISAIKYLDGSPTGSEGKFSQLERRQSIYIMLDLLPRTVAQELWAERALYWGYRMPTAEWLDWERRCREIQARWVAK